MATSVFPALSIKEPTPPLEQVGQVMQIQQAQQQLQAGQLENEQRQRALNDQDALTRAMASWNGQNYTDIPDLVTKAGGSGAARMAATNSILGIREKASEIAKSDAITAANNVETVAKQNDQYRGRILNIIGIGDEAQRQAAWDAEVTREEKAGTIQPGQFSHQYPGDAAAMNLANNFAVGSQIVKEMQDRQRIALDAWKPLEGGLVNTITQERIGPKLDMTQLNAALTARWQVLHPGEPLPDQFTLKQGTPQEFANMDKILEATERAQATKTQQEQTQAIRAQTFELARDKADLNAVVGTDPKTGRTVLVPFSQAQQMGIQNAMKADADMVNKSMAARHWLQLANTQADPKAAPADMGIMQLIDKLDSEGKLGPLAGRWNDFMSGKFGAGDAEYAALRAKMGLSTTLLMQAHVGSRGGSALLEHFEDLANAGKMDGATLKSAMGAEINYVQDKAMDANPPAYRKMSALPTSGPPAGATMKVPGSDGKMHWSDGKQDLGVVQ